MNNSGASKHSHSVPSPGLTFFSVRIHFQTYAHSCSGLVRTPSGRVVHPNLIDNGDGTVTAQFQPSEPGLHDLEVTYNGQPIPGSPFRFYVEALGSGRVTAYGPGLSYGRSGEMAEFTLVTRDAGAGTWFTGTVLGPDGLGNLITEFKVLVSITNSEGITPEEMTSALPCPTYKDLWTDRLSEPTARHPKFQRVFSEAFAPIMPQATPLYSPSGLSLAVEGPSKADIQCHDNRNGTCSVSYLPVAPGDYIISIKFMEQHIPGSPFSAHIAGLLYLSDIFSLFYYSAAHCRSLGTCPGDPRSFSQVCVGTTSEVPLRISETDIYNLTASVRSPSGREQPSLLKRMPNGHLGRFIQP
ncbi:unnamed protein product [Protopolystoma xenopodis]|uniref:Uncharacterized protein n=1 Tax=Protopolystoma xenopodis TaxID=117903 RepID=A0A448XIV0_9PLAT|nr:unnamed protein product [Protopolystoma xenopodis]